MPLILSLSHTEEGLWASGPEGLYFITDEHPQTIPQPQEQLYASAVVDKRVLVGGLPHGIALSVDSGANWHAASMDNVKSAAACLSPDPQFEASGVILAGTSDAGILRSADRGWSWTICNYGLENLSVLSIAWASPAPENVWPRWEVVFAGTEDGLYRSPNGGLGWRRCTGAEGVFQAIAVAVDFHSSGMVLAGTEENGLWYSDDGGRYFEAISGAPERINALVETPSGWLVSDDDGLWLSPDGLTWKPIPNSKPALVLLRTLDEIHAGGESSVERLLVRDLEIAGHF